jgi:hypothetical protein
MEADEAQLLVTKAMEAGEDSSDDENCTGGGRSGVQLDGIRHLSVMMPTPLDEAGVMAQGKLEFERYIHRAATEVENASSDGSLCGFSVCYTIHTFNPPKPKGNGEADHCALGATDRANPYRTRR